MDLNPTHSEGEESSSRHNHRTTVSEVAEEEEVGVQNETDAGVYMVDPNRLIGGPNELRQRNVKHTTAESSLPTKTEPPEDNYYNGGGFYECNICFDTAIHPVLTLCGHLFCWSCLAQWLNAQSRNPTCPVCKAGCGKDKVIPIYGRGKEEKDPREDPSIPTRPAGQRPPPLRDPNRPATSFFSQPFGNNAFNRGGMSISAGFGFFPLGITFNIPTGSPNTAQSPQSAFLSRLVMMLLSLLVIAIIFS